MITARAFSGKHYMVLGLARSGMAVVESLLASGARVTAWDRQAEPRDALAGRAEIADPLEIPLEGFDAIVVSPGVPLNTHPLTAKAKAAGVPIIGDIELFALARVELPPHKVVGITGTNGKSTTTALVHHIFKTADIPTTMGGNIGLPVMAQEPLPEGGVYVLELSSYQIDLTYSLDCDVAVLLNITPDHLDRYDGFGAYAAAKIRLFEMQGAHGDAIVTENGIIGDAPINELIDDATGQDGPRVHWPEVSGGGNHGASFLLDGLFWEGERITSQSELPSLQGPHNAQNILVALTTCSLLNVPLQAIVEGLRTYPGLPHRMERVTTQNGVLFINDSKATNPASTAPALAAFPPEQGRKRIHWICGGLAKEDNLDDCAPYYGNVARAYTIGEAGPMFADLLGPHMPVERCELLAQAVNKALENARGGDVIMLSPACASFDQFRDYEVRGDTFRELVAELCCGGDRAFCGLGNAAEEQGRSAA